MSPRGKWRNCWSTRECSLPRRPNNCWAAERNRRSKPAPVEPSRSSRGGSTDRARQETPARPRRPLRPPRGSRQSRPRTSRPALAGPPADSGMARSWTKNCLPYRTECPSLGGRARWMPLSDPSLAEAVQESSPLDAPVRAPRRALKTFSVVGQSPRAETSSGLDRRCGGRDSGDRRHHCLGSPPGRTPTKVLQPADAAYQAGAWADAVQQYDAFLDRYPKLAVSGRTRVRRGLARLRLALAETAAESTALATARAVLPEISPEAEFDSGGRPGPRHAPAAAGRGIGVRMPSGIRTRPRSRSPRRSWRLPNSTFPRPTSPASVWAGSKPPGSGAAQGCR